MRVFSCFTSYFLQAKAMQKKFHHFEELVFSDLWILDSGFKVSGLPIAFVSRTLLKTEQKNAQIDKEGL